jgi:hypothetical protein
MILAAQIIRLFPFICTDVLGHNELESSLFRFESFKFENSIAG